MCMNISLKQNKKQLGQALIEYVLVVMFISVIGLKFVKSFSEFVSEAFGDLGHVMTTTLTTGACERQCFFSAYRNGPKE